MYSVNILNKNGTAFSKILSPYNLNFKLTLSGKDTAKFSLPITHPRAENQNFKKHNRVEICRVNPKDKNDVRKVWGGYIEAMRTADENTLEVGCRGMLQFLNKRIVSRSFTNWQGGAAIYELLENQINAENDTSITAGETDVDTQFTYEFADLKALKVFEKIAQATGAELAIDTDFHLNVKKQIGEDKISKVIFRHQESLQVANSIDKFTLLQEGKELYNRVICYGKNKVISSVQEDLDSIAEYGLLEKVRYYTLIEDQATLDRTATELLDFHKPVKQIPTIRPDKEKIDLFDYQIGDRVRVIIKQGTLDFDQTHRILEINVKVGREEQEKITLKVAKEGTKSEQTEEEKLADLYQRVEELES
jgi:hypothetical protein